MDAMKVKTSLLSVLNDSIEATSTPGGILLTTPFCYSDGDRIELLVSADGAEVRVSDGGSTDIVLELAGVNVERELARDVMRDSVAHLFPFGVDDSSIETVTTTGGLGQAVVDVIEAVIRIEGVKFLPEKQSRARLSKRVTDHLKRAVAQSGANAQVARNYRLATSGGRQRSVTAAVTMDDRAPLVMQAVNTARDAAEQSIAGCYYAFDAAATGAYSERVAVLGGSRETVDQGILNDLQSVSERVVFEHDEEFEQIVAKFLQPAMA